MSNESGFGGGDILLAFLLGGVVGAGIMLLMAPESGEDMRKRVKEYKDTTKSKATEYADKTKETLSSTIDRGKEIYEEKRSAISDAIMAGKEAYLKEKENTAKEG